MKRAAVLPALAAAAALAGGAGAQTPAPYDAQAQVTEAIARIRAIAMNRERVDWAAAEADARAEAATARDRVDMLPVYARLLQRLGDGHSTLRSTPELAAAWRARRGDAPLLADAPARRPFASTFMRRTFELRDLRLPDGRSARLITVTPIQDTDPSRAYADRIFNAVVDAPAACGFIVDLRGNLGGNMWPMMSGLAPLLGEGARFYAPSGPEREGWYAILQAGAWTMRDPQGRPRNPLAHPMPRAAPPTLANAPVAVLTDDATASSGEAIAMAFAGRPLTRSFGRTTRGLTTANTPVALSDGVVLAITTGEMRDRNGRTYPGGVQPDLVVEAGPGRADDPDDAVEEAAKVWLAQQRACS